jgi:hypothetical protein
LIAAELEAWVLTGSHPELIAERCGLRVEVVLAYEVVYFDVRHLLAAPGYVFHQVIGRPIIDGFSLDDLGPIWKFCAYVRGPHALDILLYVFSGGKPRPWPSAFPATPAQQRALIATCKLMVLTRCVRIADMATDEMARFLFLSNWFQQFDEADSVMSFGIGAISEVDVSSLLGARVEDPDRQDLEIRVSGVRRARFVHRDWRTSPFRLRHLVRHRFHGSPHINRATRAGAPGDRLTLA